MNTQHNHQEGNNLYKKGLQRELAEFEASQKLFNKQMELSTHLTPSQATILKQVTSKKLTVTNIIPLDLLENSSSKISGLLWDIYPFEMFISQSIQKGSIQNKRLQQIISSHRQQLIEHLHLFDQEQQEDILTSIYFFDEKQSSNDLGHIMLHLVPLTEQQRDILLPLIAEDHPEIVLKHLSHMPEIHDTQKTIIFTPEFVALCKEEYPEYLLELFSHQPKYISYFAIDIDWIIKMKSINEAQLFACIGYFKENVDLSKLPSDFFTNRDPDLAGLLSKHYLTLAPIRSELQTDIKLIRYSCEIDPDNTFHYVKDFLDKGTLFTLLVTDVIPSQSRTRSVHWSELYHDGILEELFGKLTLQEEEIVQFIPHYEYTCKFVGSWLYNKLDKSNIALMRKVAQCCYHEIFDSLEMEELQPGIVAQFFKNYCSQAALVEIGERCLMKRGTNPETLEFFHYLTDGQNDPIIPEVSNNSEKKADDINNAKEKTISAKEMLLRRRRGEM